MLPLDNYSGDPNQDYFAEGMTDELTADLATISQLRVISRGSAMQFKGKDRPPTPEIARMLNVDAIVEGSVSRSGDKVRITAQLIDARADKHLWAKTFERSSRDVLALQAELASAIAREINVQLTPSEQSRLTAAPSVNPEAHDAYLKGRYFFNRPSDENLKKAIAQFEEAVRLSPDFAPAYSGLSDAYLWAGYNEGFLTATEARPKAKAAAEKAVALDDNSAEAHTSLAVFKLFYEYDRAGCEREFRRAFALNPNYAFAHDQFGHGAGLPGTVRRSDRRGHARDRTGSAVSADPDRCDASRSCSNGTPRRPRSSARTGSGARSDLLLPRHDRRVDRPRSGEVPRGDPGVEESQGDGVAPVRDRVSRVRLRRRRRSSPRDGGNRGPQEDVTGWRGAAVQPGDGAPRPWRSHARARLPRTGVRGRFADDGVAREGCHLRPPPLGAALRGAVEEDAARPVESFSGPFVSSMRTIGGVAKFIGYLALLAAIAVGITWYSLRAGIVPSSVTPNLRAVAEDTSWLSDLYSQNPRDTAKGTATVEKLGVRALPRIQATLRDPKAERSHRRAALRACAILAVTAEPAIPDVAAALSEHDLAADAAVALSFMGPRALPLSSGGVVERRSRWSAGRPSVRSASFASVRLWHRMTCYRSFSTA